MRSLKMVHFLSFLLNTIRPFRIILKYVHWSMLCLETRKLFQHQKKSPFIKSICLEDSVAIYEKYNLLH